LADPRIVTLTNGAFAENCHLVADPESGDAAVVDPGEAAPLFLARLGREGWTARAIWLTHAHVDHVAGVAAVRAATGAPVWLHPADRPLYDRAAQQARAFGLVVDAPPPPDAAFQEGVPVRVGGLSFDVLHTPGHSPGSVSLAGHGAVFVGDVLFAGSVGRTDLPGGDAETLLSSIRVKLYALPDPTVVYAGHGPATTIGEEKRSNPFARLVPGVHA
jgi:glyoxylase-like metal-dependent hydrolase (beta-lactamase superfamily II)